MSVLTEREKEKKKKEKWVSILVKKEIKDALDRQKVHPRQSYGELIMQLIEYKHAYLHKD